MSSNSSNSSNGDLGNTKTKSQDTPCKKWCFTLHKFINDDIVFLNNFFSSNSSKFIFSEEKGKSGETPHLQGYVEFKTKKRLTALVKFALSNKAHWEKAKGSYDDNYAYITKEGGKLYGSHIPEKIYCEEPNEKLSFLIDLMKQYEFPKGDRNIHVVVDTVGGLGKTEFARYCVMNFDRCIVTGGKSADMKNQIVSYKTLTGKTPKYIILDVPRSNIDFLSYTGIEEIKNMLFYSGKYEGSMINGNKPFMLILMNEHPKFENMSADRWKVYEINNEESYDCE